MAVTMEAVQGLIELKDDFTSQIGLAQAALSNFSKENQASLTAVAQAAGLVTAALGATAAAVVALGIRGSDINDVRNTLDQFSGSAENAEVVLQELRSGVKGTVDDFTLAKEAAHLLSAGVKLTADDFGLLGEAAFVLADRGLGTTEQMLELVGDALTTGKTKMLAMKVGVVDAGDAEENYAKTLGVTAAQLSETGKAEAHRIEVMRIMSEAVKGAGESERDFGEQLQAARVFIQNWLDDLASAIAASPVFEAGMKAIQIAVADAFGGDNQDSVKQTVDAIEEATIMAVNFGLGAVEVARVVHTAWSVIKTIVLGVGSAIIGMSAGINQAIAVVAEVAASLPGATDGMKAMAVTARDVATEWTAMAASLDAEAKEAAKGIIGHSEFDKTLDHLGGTLFQVKDAMQAANKATGENVEVTDIAAKNAATMAKLSAEMAKSSIDRAKVEEGLWKVQKKSLEETSILWNEYFSLRVKNSGTTTDAQKADIESGFNDEVEKLDASDRNWQEHYDALVAVSSETLKAVSMDWDSVKDKSVESLRQTAERARNTYNEMIYGSLHFSREALDEQLQKTRAAEDAARGMGQAYVDAQTAAIKLAKDHKKELEEVEEAARAAAKAGREMAITTEVNAGNLGGFATSFGIDPGFAEKWAREGFSFTEILNAFKGGYTPKNPHGPRIEGFAEGGTILVGERGPEVVRLPFGSTVFPSGASPGGVGAHITNHIYINDTLESASRKVASEIMRTAKQSRMFGTS